MRYVMRIAQLVNHRIFERTLRCGSQCLSMPGRVSFPTLSYFSFSFPKQEGKEKLWATYRVSLYVFIHILLIYTSAFADVGWESVCLFALQIPHIVSWNRHAQTLFVYVKKKKSNFLFFLSSSHVVHASWGTEDWKLIFDTYIYNVCVEKPFLLSLQHYYLVHADSGQTSTQARLPAEFKHIIKRRKRN